MDDDEVRRITKREMRKVDFIATEVSAAWLLSGDDGGPIDRVGNVMVTAINEAKVEVRVVIAALHGMLELAAQQLSAEDEQGETYDINHVVLALLKLQGGKLSSGPPEDEKKDVH